MIKLKYLDNNKVVITYCGDLHSFDTYINKLLFKTNIKLSPCISGGWIFHINEIDKLYAYFNRDNIKEENEYIAPPYNTIGENLKLEPYEYQKEAIYHILNEHSTLLVTPCGSGKYMYKIF